MRDDFLVVIDWEAHTIRAGVGVGEVVPLPSVVRSISQKADLRGRSS